MDEAAGAAVNQGQSGRDQRVVWRSEANLLRECEAQDRARLRILGQRALRGAVDQRVEVGQAAQRLAGDGDREPLVGIGQADRTGGGVQRTALAQHAVEQLQRRAPSVEARLSTWHGRARIPC